MRKPFVAGNWKMNKTLDEALSLARGVAEGVASFDDVDVVVAPVSTCLHAVGGALKGTNVGLSSQNMHWAANGAYTGELSTDMLKDVGCAYAILGHSERREYFAETDEGVNRKLHAAIAAGLTAIVCIGESLAERESGWTDNKVAMQVRAALSGVDTADLDKVVLAYEPIWAIGTGVTASPEQAQEVHAMIRGLLGELYDDAGLGVRVLYGGSVKPSNIAELIAQPDVDGALVGGASLKPEDFVAIAKACSRT